MTALLSMETRALVFECMCVLCVFVCTHYSFALRRVTRSSGGVLYKKYRLEPQINAHKLSASPSVTFSLNIFFVVVQFKTGMKSFFFFFFPLLLRDILKALVSVALVKLLMPWMRH